jgi:hypothetical protein
MTTVIDGTTGTSIAGASSTVGNFTVGGALAVTGNTTLTGTLTVGGASVAVQGPAFSAYRTAARNTAAAGWQSVIPDTEEFDTASCYNTTTGRFTPNVAGYYQFSGQAYSSASTGSIMSSIYKNGAAFKTGSRTASGGAGSSVSALIYMNGTTDYVELYVYYSASPAIALSVGGETYNYLQGVYVRPA